MCNLDDARTQLPRRLAGIYEKAKRLFDQVNGKERETRVQELREEVRRMDAFLRRAGLDLPESE